MHRIYLYIQRMHVHTGHTHIYCAGRECVCALASWLLDTQEANKSLFWLHGWRLKAKQSWSFSLLVCEKENVKTLLLSHTLSLLCTTLSFIYLSIHNLPGSCVRAVFVSLRLVCTAFTSTAPSSRKHVGWNRGSPVKQWRAIIPERTRELASPYLLLRFAEILD